jgi:formylglycine-generating enzyme required for sulfatase activity
VPVLTNSIGMQLALIPTGSFVMGSPDDEEDRSEDEGPQHQVEITRPFYLGLYPVTQAQWRAVMGKNPSWFKERGRGNGAVKGMDTSDFPVEQAS